MQPTKYKNLYRTNGVFEYIYAEDNFKIEARDWNDLKFKLAMSKIELQEKSSAEKDKISVKRIHKENKQIKPVKPESHSNEIASKMKSMRKNVDYVESEEDVSFGKIKYTDPITGYEVKKWGPDNSKRARKLREELIR